MTLSRRRFIALSACAAVAGPTCASPSTSVWRGRALGAEVVVSLRGANERDIWRLGQRIAAQLDRLESALSLHRASELVRLNETGLLAHPSPFIAEMIALSDRLYATTGGAFDPSVQSAWLAQAQGRRTDVPFGWSKIDRDRGIRLPEGMALTFNGVAQGYAADLLAELIREAGYQDVVVDAGEIVAMGQGWPVDIVGDDDRVLRQIVLRDRCIATSSPRATLIGPDAAPHIFHPDGRSIRWRTVSVAASSAAVADGLSTAFCLMQEHEITETLTQWPDASLVLRT